MSLEKRHANKINDPNKLLTVCVYPVYIKREIGMAVASASGGTDDPQDHQPNRCL